MLWIAVCKARSDSATVRHQMQHEERVIKAGRETGYHRHRIEVERALRKREKQSRDLGSNLHRHLPEDLRYTLLDYLNTEHVLSV